MNQIYDDMVMARKDSDTELKVAGIPVTRIQFNCIFMEVDKLLKEAERTSGIKAEWNDLAPLVFIFDHDRRYGLQAYFTVIWKGWYRGDTLVSTVYAGVGIKTYPYNNHDLQVAVKLIYDPIGEYDLIIRDEVTIEVCYVIDRSLTEHLFAGIYQG